MNKVFPRMLMSMGGALATLVAVGACSSGDLAGNDLQTVSLSFTAARSSASASAVDAAGAVAPAAAVISKIQIVLTKMELARTGNVACVSDSENDDDDAEEAKTAGKTSSDKTAECQHISRSPLLIDMPVDGSLKTQIAVPLTAGTYKMIEAKLEPASDKDSAGKAFLKAHPEFSAVSVKVIGTYNGAAFTYKSALRAGIHMNFNPPLVIDATTKNATISVDVSKWFLTSSGEAIDPTKALPGTSGGKAVENNIRASFHAFEDNDKKGKDEGEGHGKGKSGK